MRQERRVLIGPSEIAGYYRDLCEGLRGVGVACDFVTYSEHPYQYGGETLDPLLLRAARRIARSGVVPERLSFWQVVRALPAVLLQSLWACVAICRYDVFIFGFGHSLLRGNWDLPLLRLLGKTVISNFGHGSEARPPYIDGARQSVDGRPPTSEDLLRATRKVAACVRRHERYATVRVGAPFSSTQFATRTLINWFALGVPCREPVASCGDTPQSDLVRIAEPGDSQCLRVLHAPSHPAAKGTAAVVAAVDSLAARGYRIELVQVAGRPVSEVLAALQRCDFVIDQVFSDTPMAGFAAQAAWFGKPAVVAGYGLDRLRYEVPDGMWPPSQQCRPDELEQAIEALVVNPELREHLGRCAQAFVRGPWSAEAVARRYLSIIEGQIPADWLFDPERVAYLHGVGQSEARTKETIRSLVERHGVAALGLRGRPALESAFLRFAGLDLSHDPVRAASIP
jgi:hypothetical protein